MEFIKSEEWFGHLGRGLQGQAHSRCALSLRLTDVKSFQGLCSLCLPHRKVWPHLACCLGMAQSDHNLRTNARSVDRSNRGIWNWDWGICHMNFCFLLFLIGISAFLIMSCWSWQLYIKEQLKPHFWRWMPKSNISGISPAPKGRTYKSSYLSVFFFLKPS